jgi:hypothetical protein
VDVSQHYFSTSTPDGQPVTVLLGWDRPLGQYFLVVELEQDGEEANDEYLYSNLDDPQAWRQPLEYYQGKLVQLGMQVPATMFQEVCCDQEFNVGNR